MKRGCGRPKLSPKRKRSVAVKVWMSPGEALRVKELAEEQQKRIGAYLREKGLA